MWSSEGRRGHPVNGSRIAAAPAAARRGIPGLATLALLAACAFTPVYGPQGGGARLDGAVAVQEATSARSFTMSGALERALGPARDPRYRLGYDYDVDAEDAAITSGQEIDRVNLIGRLDYRLREIETGTLASSGRVTSFVGFSAAGDSVATNAARADAERRLAQILADQATRQLLTDPALADAGAAGSAP